MWYVVYMRFDLHAWLSVDLFHVPESIAQDMEVVHSNAFVNPSTVE